MIYTGNAGIVLIHPFLSEFFGKLGLLDNARLFTNIDSAVRGIFLLHFLATGTTELEEFQSGLYKILCGIPLGQAIPRNLNLFKEELEESETLLRSAIGHWKILKNTSPNGLRETFFQREGKLEITDQGWILKVEQRSVDILISHLPWTYSIVKLPWMDQTLW
ncbi:hypothetical protein GWO43_12185, partial [candidate division KSB1 bacterium]|nr:hypothetical protein [candidate division KSB1 bacterium]NIT71621.1 hypothetical protein [candidate division KSB1 bacterium]NIX71301.1 hypothetical protein [candidate division KSB1 bacterium]